MIVFHNDHLVPPELCYLVYQTVPPEFHVPVVFFNRNSQLPKENRRTLGVCYGPWISIHLHQIFSYTHWGSSSMAAALWRKTLEVLWHEFGHLATWDLIDYIPSGAYRARGREYKYVEKAANDYRDRLLAETLARDSRLGQPNLLGGYYGARIAKTLKWLASYMGGSAKAMYVKELRCLQTGGQLSSGDVLCKAGFPPRWYPNAYRVLRKVSVDLGISHIDAAGRRQKLYTWGDVPVVVRRLEEARAVGMLREYQELREQKRNESDRKLDIPEPPLGDFPFDEELPF